MERTDLELLIVLRNVAKTAVFYSNGLCFLISFSYDLSGNEKDRLHSLIRRHGTRALVKRLGGDTRGIYWWKRGDKGGRILFLQILIRRERNKQKANEAKDRA